MSESSGIPPSDGAQPTIKRRLLNALAQIYPSLADRIVARRARQQLGRLEQRHGLDRISAQFMALNGGVVAAGPFVGMKYGGISAGRVAVPKLLVSEELELHAAIEAAIACRPSVVIDVGAAEGYYAVGLARRLPAAHIFTFDTDPVARGLCQTLARANEVEDRTDVLGRCGQDDLTKVLVPGPLLVSDCEGIELACLCPT